MPRATPKDTTAVQAIAAVAQITLPNVTEKMVTLNRLAEAMKLPPAYSPEQIAEFVSRGTVISLSDWRRLPS